MVRFKVVRASRLLLVAAIIVLAAVLALVGAQLLRRDAAPAHSGSANLFGEADGWRMDVTLFMTGERFTTSANLPAYRIAPWQTLDATISKSLSIGGRDLSFKLSLRNLLDEQYEIVDNYPMPGFNFLLKVEATL